MSRYAFYDFETSSVINLRTAGVHQYINDPSTRIISAAFMVDGRVCSLRFATGKIELPTAIQVAIKTHTFVAHNGELFDELLWRKHIPDAIPKFEDTLHLARLAGYPGKLAELYKIICGVEKGDNIPMLLLSQAKYGPQGKVIYPMGTKALWDKLLAYNEQDVRHLATVHTVLRKHLTATEAKVIQHHRAINARGFMVDREYVTRMLNEWTRVQNTAKDEISRITGGILTGDDIRSPAKVKKWLESIGFECQSLDRKVIDRILANPEEFQTDDDGEKAIALLAQRQNAVRSVTGKLETILETLDSDSTIRNVLVYGGAQTTMRFSGRTVQPHNFPRGVKLDDVSPAALDDVPSVAIRNSKTEADVLSTLSRSIVRPRKGCKFIISDYNAIEARVLAWLSECSKLLNIYKTKGDPYRNMAAALFGIAEGNVNSDQRFVGKQVVLASGYQAGGPKVDLMCQMYGINLEAIGLSGNIAKDTFRKTYYEIPLLWKAYNNAALIAVEHGQETTIGKCTFYTERESHVLWLCVRLPSGRSIRYRNARIEDCIAPWGGTVAQIKYDTGYGYSKKLYGGILCVGADTMVLTDMGVKPIVAIRNTDKVWDGVEWVSTGGLLNKGKGRVGKWLGVSITATHEITDGKTWLSVIDADESYTRAGLKWAQDSIDLSCSSPEQGTIPLQNANAIADNWQQCQPARSIGAILHNVDVADIRSQNLLRGLFLELMSILELSPDVTIKKASHTLTMATVASEFILNGNPTEQSSLSTSRLYPDGITFHWNLTELKITKDTYPEIYAWLLERLTQITDAETGPSFKMIEAIPRQNLLDCSALYGLREVSCITYQTAETQDTLWQDTGNTVPVYDLLNCGPRNRFTIITEFGPVIIHNCENIDQAISRDVMVHHLTTVAEQPILHVHDEIVFEIPVANRNSLMRVENLMQSPPAWADGLPLGVEAFESMYYTKYH